MWYELEARSVGMEHRLEKRAALEKKILANLSSAREEEGRWIFGHFISNGLGEIKKIENEEITEEKEDSTKQRPHKSTNVVRV